MQCFQPIEGVLVELLDGYTRMEHITAIRFGREFYQGNREQWLEYAVNNGIEGLDHAEWLWSHVVRKTQEQVVIQQQLLKT